MIKQKLQSAWNWTKDKAMRFWAWTKRQWKKIAAVVVVGTALAAPFLIPTYPIEYVTAPENNTYKIGVMNYDAVLASDITADQALKYQLDDKFISFKPVEMRWDNSSFKSIRPQQAKIEKKKYIYENAFGEGIDIDMNFGERIFEKIVKIESLESLGEIPAGAEYLEIEFEVETNFVIDGWNKYDKFEIADTVRLGDFSYIEPANAWDSYKETICENKEICEDTCDDWCVSDLDGCDVCECEIQEVCDTFNNKIQIQSYFQEKNGRLIYVKQIPIDWLQKAQFPVYSDVDITYGTADIFTDTQPSNIAITELDTDKLAFCYIDEVGLDDGCCIVATVSGTEFTKGSSSCFDTDVCVSASVTPIDVCKLDTDKMAVVYTDDGADDDGFARAVTVSGTTIGTWGTAKEFETTDMETVSCAGMLDTATDKFVACYNDEDDSDTGKCVAMTVSGTTITAGSPVNHLSGTTDYWPRWMVTKPLDTDKFVTCFYSVDTDGGHCVVGTIATVTITMGTAADVVANITVAQVIGVAQLDTDKFVVAYRDDDISGLGYEKAGTVSTTTITFGTAVNYDTSNYTAEVAAAKIDTTSFLTVYDDTDAGGQSNKGTVDWADRSITVSETVDNYEAGEISNDWYGGIKLNDIAFISTNKLVICFVDDDDSNKGKCIIGDVSVAPPPARRIIIE